MQAITTTGLTKRYDGATALDLESWSVPAGELFVIVGPSGSGKSTLLRILAGLTRADSGAVELFGADAAPLAPHERSVAMVFQGLALWPHLSVRGNLALGLDRIVPDAAERRTRIEETAAELDLSDKLARRPHELSGGERQRVAYARALVRRPRLLLLDEPFSDLDALLRRRAARLLRRIHDQHEMTTVLVTHDRSDAHLLADRIGVMRGGRFLASGRPDELHARSRSAFAAEFLSDATIVPATADGTRAESVVGPLTLTEPASGSVLAALRPDELTLADDGARGVVSACEFAGGVWCCRVDLDGLEVAVQHDRALPHGESVFVRASDAPRPALTEDR